MDIRHYRLSGLAGKREARIPLGSDVPDGLEAFITLCAAGNMSRQKEGQIPDRLDYLQSREIGPGQLYSVAQNHTRKVVCVDPQRPVDDYSSLVADGIIAPEAPVFLGITVADCLPIFLFDKRQGCFGALHSGWKGTGIVLPAVSAMERDFRCKREDLCAVIGPGIGHCCYRVSKERHDSFISRYGKGAGEKGAGGYFINLRAANIRLLSRAGIGSVSVIDNCTCCEREFHSFRREGKDFGQMLAYIGYSRNYPERQVVFKRETVR